MKRPFKILNYVVFMNLLMLLGCAPAPNNTEIKGFVKNVPLNKVSLAANDNTQVDCILPGQLRKLGRSMTYLTKESEVKLTPSECKIRGGVYAIEKDVVSVK